MSKSSLVLLVDDAPQNIQVLGNILKNQGYSFALTSSGSETFKLLSKKKPDIILLDIMLPDEDGFSICGKIKQDPLLSDIPIIFLSAKHDINDKIKGFQLGAVDYITKPFEDIEVIQRVSNHLQAKLDRDKIEKYCGPNLDEKTFYVCGPVKMAEGLMGILRKMGVSERRIRREIFSFLD